MTNLLLRGGRVVDPDAQKDALLDVLIRDGRIAELLAPRATVNGAEVLDVHGQWVLPGLVDLRIWLKGSGDLQAALQGGFTTVVATPESDPVSSAHVNVVKAAALTKQLAGEELGEVPSGARLSSNGFKPVVKGGLMRRALQYARPLGVTVMTHAEDPSLSGKGVLGEGFVATHLGLPPVPASAETSIVARDLAILDDVGGRLHFSHLTCASSIRLLREAKARGLKVTADVTPHHLSKSDLTATGYSLEARVWPPLRPQADVDALRAALADGTLDAVATDHVTVDGIEREHPFDMCAPGIAGAASAVSTLLSLGLERTRLAQVLAQHPARIAGLDAGTLRIGARADVAIIDPNRKAVRYTLCGGVVRFEGVT